MSREFDEQKLFRLLTDFRIADGGHGETFASNKISDFISESIRLAKSELEAAAREKDIKI